MPGIPQLVAERKDGKRPGYRGDAAYRSGSEQSSRSRGGQGNVGSQASFGGGRDDGPSPSQNNNNNNIVMENIGSPGIEDVTGSFAEFGPVTYKAPSIFNPMSGVYAPTNMMFKNMQTLDRFTKYRPEVPTLPGIPTILNAIGFDVPNPLQGFSDFTTAKNRNFFQDVIRAGKIPGVNFATLSDMSDEDLENAYQSYMSDRLSGKIDAYGNPLPQSDSDSNPLQNLLLAQQLANSTVDQQENLQGGVAQLYNQYMRNLGYTL